MRTLRDLVDRDATGAPPPRARDSRSCSSTRSTSRSSRSTSARRRRTSDSPISPSSSSSSRPSSYAARKGTSRLGPARILWIPGIALLVWLAFQALRPASVDDALFEDHLVSYVEARRVRADRRRRARSSCGGRRTSRSCSGASCSGRPSRRRSPSSSSSASTSSTPGTQAGVSRRSSATTTSPRSARSARRSP